VILAENKAAPLRFLIAVSIGWVMLRGVMLSDWTPGATLAPRWGPGRDWLSGMLRPWRIAAVPPMLSVAPSRVAPRSPAPSPWRPVSRLVHWAPEGPLRVGMSLDDATMRYLALAGQERPDQSYYARATAGHEADAITGAAATPPAPGGASASRWSGSGWAFARGGGHARPLSPVGQIGAGQAGVRALYRLDGGVSLSGRISRTIGGPDQTEAALGIDWQPLAHVPIHLTAERRIAIDHGGRNAFALGAAGGVYAVPLAPGWRLDGYGEAGVVGARRRDLYADGAVRAGREIALGGGTSLTLGAGAWGAAQPHAARLDVGPSAVLRVPVDHRTIAFALDYRGRVAGDARPHSGVALTVGVDF
jgi:hypothetical protein